MKKTHYHQAPAFPPQIAQDHLGQLVAPVPGMTKLEYFSIQLLPSFIALAKMHPLMDNGKAVTPVEAAINTAKTLLDKLNDKNDDKETLQIIE